MKKLMNLMLSIAVLMFATTLFVACEKPLLDEDNFGSTKDYSNKNVVIHFSTYDYSSMTRAAQNVTAFCSRINVAIFNESGSKVASEAQKSSDSDYGVAAFDLPEGTYTVVGIAHSCDGSATISSPDKVTFPSNKVTDTFYYYGEIEVTAEPHDYSLQMTRAVAMFRLTLTDDPLPETLTQFKFYYTGGSSTFNPSTGFGCVNSKQTEYRTTTADTKVYEVYSFPHTESDVLKITITALNATGVTISERLFEDVPIKLNTVTSYTGSFFNGSSGTITSSSVGFTADNAWSAVNMYDF